MRNIFIYIVVAISLFTFQSEKVFAQDYVHIHKILDTESAILALGASNSATAGQFYYATDTDIYFLGQQDGSILPYPATFNVVDIDDYCGDIPFANKIDYLRYNRGAETVTDTTKFDNLCNATTNLRYLLFYSFTWTQGMSSNLICPTLQYLYQFNGSVSGKPWPYMPLSNDLRYFRLQNDANAPSSIPISWQNAKRLQRIYYQRNGLASSEVDNLIIELEARVTSGMSALYGGTRYFYMNGTGTNANATPTIAIHTANGWTNNGSYLQKTISGQTWRVYFNP